MLHAPRATPGTAVMITPMARDAVTCRSPTATMWTMSTTVTCTGCTTTTWTSARPRATPSTTATPTRTAKGAATCPCRTATTWTTSTTGAGTPSTTVTGTSTEIGPDGHGAARIPRRPRVTPPGPAPGEPGGRRSP